MLAKLRYYGIAFLLALCFGLIYWSGETLIHFFIFHTNLGFLPEEPNEFWMRACIVLLFIVLTMVIAYFLRKNVELRKQVELAHMALHIMQEGVVITDAHNNILYANPRYTDITGYSLAEVLGKNPNVSSSGKQSKAFYQDLWQSLQTKGHWEGEMWNRRKSGELYPEWISISMLKDKKNKPIYHVAVLNDITSQKKIEDKIKHYAFYDPLTNLPNRRFFMESLRQAIKVTKRERGLLAVLFLDLDHFKEINDQYGHAVGDQFLCQVANLIQTELREADFVSRFGGDEFVVLLRDIKTKEAALTVAKKILSSFQASNILISEHRLQAKVSIGGAVFPDDAEEAEALLNCADEAMYTIKTTTREAIAFYTNTAHQKN